MFYVSVHIYDFSEKITLHQVHQNLWHASISGFTIYTEIIAVVHLFTGRESIGYPTGLLGVTC